MLHVKFVKVKMLKHTVSRVSVKLLANNFHFIICVHCYLTFNIPHGDRSYICEHLKTKEHKGDIYTAFSPTKFI
jgi:hypothetical protein